MARQGVTRKLAAILAADVVGYSRLMEADEGATIRMLDTLSLLKTSYPAGTLAFTANAGYHLRHANDSLSPPRHSP